MMIIDNLVAKQKETRTGNSDSIKIIRAAKRYEREAEVRLRATVKTITPFMRAKEYLRKAYLKAKTEGSSFDRDAVVRRYEQMDPKAAAAMRAYIDRRRRANRKAQKKLRDAMSPEEKRAVFGALHRQRKVMRDERLRNTVITCKGPECDVQWCTIPGIRGNKPLRYCSKKCQNLYFYRKARAKKASA